MVDGGKQPMPSKITMSRNKALIDVPAKVPIQVRLNDRTPRLSNFKVLSSGSPTEFREIDEPGMPSAEDMIQEYCPQFFTTLKNLPQVHKSTINPKTGKPDPTRITILDCALDYIDTEPNAKTGNYRMVVSDDSLEFTEEDRRGTVVWVPEHCHPDVEDAGKGTRMFVVGQTSQPQTRLDFETGKTLNEPGDVGMNAMGIIVKEGWLMPKDEAFLKEDVEMIG